MDTKEIEDIDDGGVLGTPFPVVHYQLICLVDVVVGDQANHRCVVSKLNDGVGVVRGHASNTSLLYSTAE